MANAAVILERVNQFVGFGLVHRLKVTQDLPLAPANQKPIAHKTQTQSDIKSQSLQEALEKLGKAIGAKAEK